MGFTLKSCCCYEQKVEYMASLNLVTQERLKELEMRRGGRRKRTTAVPQFSYVHGHLQPEVRIFRRLIDML